MDLTELWPNIETQQPVFLNFGAKIKLAKSDERFRQWGDVMK